MPPIRSQFASVSHALTTNMEASPEGQSAENRQEVQLAENRPLETAQSHLKGRMHATLRLRKHYAPPRSINKRHVSHVPARDWPGVPHFCAWRLQVRTTHPFYLWKEPCQVCVCVYVFVRICVCTQCMCVLRGSASTMEKDEHVRVLFGCLFVRVNVCVCA